MAKWLLGLAPARVGVVRTATDALEEFIVSFGEASAPVLTRPIAGPLGAVLHVAGSSQRAPGGRRAGPRAGELSSGAVELSLGPLQLQSPCE